MPKKCYKAIGLMSGSSMDGLDIAFCEFTVDKTSPSGSLIISNWRLVEAETIPFSQKWRERILLLTEQNALILAQTHTYFGHYLGALVDAFLQKHQLEPDFIASHGHTIYHIPSKRFTLQIGDGAALAALTGYPVICDFRTQDVAIDGEGAPITPIADKNLFPGNDFYLNLGGIANITCNAGGRFIAFDVGGANQLLNALARERGLEYDKDGEIAASGKLQNALFEKLNGQDFFQQDYPKSLSNQWVQQTLITACLQADLALEDKMRTACEHIAFQIARSLWQLLQKEAFQKKGYRIFVTGGGALNSFLIDCIQKQCMGIAPFEFILPEREIINFKEAIMIALMGVLRLENVANCLCSVTGARMDTIGGAIHQGWKVQI